MKAIIVGAGLGGLTAALALRQRGFQVQVLERSSELREVGAGIQMSANAVKVLHALGLESALRRVAFQPEAFTGWDWKSGEALYRTPLGETHEASFGAPYFHVHRADLQGLLAQALGPSLIELGAVCVEVGCAEGEPGALAHVTLADGRKLEADVIVGADGIHSSVRASLFGRDAPQFTGNMCWRGMVPTEVLPPQHVPPTSSNWLGPQAHVVHYYVSQGRMVNFVAIHETREWVAESWTVPSSVDELLHTFRDWHPRLLTLLGAAQDLNKWGLFDRDPLPRWTRGKVTLLGDAAHPMLPFLAQGAAQAIEDGYLLARALAEQPERDRSQRVEAALQRYEAARRPRTSAVQLAARARSKTLHLTSQAAREQRDREFRQLQESDKKKTMFAGEWLYAHDVTGPGGFDPGTP